MAFAGDPLGARLVASLNRPGGNITGMSLATPDLAGTVVAGDELLDPACIDVEPDRLEPPRQRHRHRQPDIAEPDHGDAAPMFHRNQPSITCTPIGML